MDFIKIWGKIFVAIYFLVFGCVFIYANMLFFAYAWNAPNALVSLFIIVFGFFTDGYAIQMAIHIIKD